MSFILDALKKSETDRQRQTGPALFEVKVAQPKAGFPVWAIAIVVLLVINMVIVGWLLLRHQSKTEADAQAQVAGQPTPTSPPNAAGSQLPAPANVATQPVQYNGQPVQQGYAPNSQQQGYSPNSQQQGYSPPPQQAYSAPGQESAPAAMSRGQANTQPDDLVAGRRIPERDQNEPTLGDGAGRSGGPGANGAAGFNGSGANSNGGAGFNSSGGASSNGGAGFNGSGASSNGGAGFNGSGASSNGGAGFNGGGASSNGGAGFNGSGARSNGGAGFNRSGTNANGGAGMNAAASTGNPDDDAPAQDPGSPLFKGHVKRGTESGLMLYQDLAVTNGANLPELRLDMHVYDPKPQARFALINMQKVTEGQVMKGEVKVEAITPEGVVMSHNGTRFLLPRE